MHTLIALALAVLLGITAAHHAGPGTIPVSVTANDISGGGPPG